MANKTQPLMKCARLNPIVERIHPSPQKTQKVKLWLSVAMVVKTSSLLLNPVMASKAAPLNEMCPIKPDRRADPSITAKIQKVKLWLSVVMVVKTSLLLLNQL